MCFKSFFALELALHSLAQSLPCGAARMSFQVKPDRFQQLNQEIICQLSIVF